MSSAASFGPENRGFQAGAINGPVSTSFHFGSGLRPNFFKTSNYESHKNVNPERVPHTCGWFLEHSTFQKWKASSTNDLLWLSADPGCGKSVLSRALIDEKLVATEAATLCYFFFKDNEEQNKTTTALCALLHQLLCAYDSLLQKYVALAIEKCGDALRNEVEELWRVFLSVATDPSVGNVICILDALDECRHVDRNILIESLKDFYTSRDPTPGSTLKFIVTSRPYNDIELCFHPLTEEVPTIRLAGEEESDKISLEIGIVINTKVKEISNKRRLREDVQSALQRRLSETPNRTYLWLHLTLDQVEKALGSTQKKLLEAINTLPTTVEEAYEKILARCERRETTMKVLQMIVVAQRPLTLSEIDVALEINPDSQSYTDLDLEGDEERRTWIRAACGLFVSVIGSHIFLIHQTAREFLVRKDNERSCSQEWRHSIDLQTAHQVLLKICVTYLLFEETQKCRYLTFIDDEEHAKRFALLDYSASHWILHAQEANIKSSVWVSKTVKLCDMSDRSSWTWFNIYKGSTYDPRELSDNCHRYTMYWTAVFGLVHETEYLLNSGLGLNKRPHYFTNALQASARNVSRGKELVVLFLRLGDKVIITEKVVEAAAGNTGQGREVMALLLDQRGDEIKITEEVVKAAAGNSLNEGNEVMALLLKRGADKFIISEGLVAEIARSFDREAMTLLLDQRGDEIDITEGVVKAAVWNRLSEGNEEQTGL